MRSTLYLALLLTVSAVSAAEPFDEQRKKASAAIANQSEDAIIALLEAGLEESKVSQAHAVAGGWFLQNRPSKAKTLLLAAQVAEFSAHFPAAVSFYQQFLEKADVKSKESQDAVVRLYRLMVDVMGNKDNAAYFYMLNHAEGFMSHGSARQYNTWLLSKANGDGRPDRASLPDLVKLLGAVCRAGYSKDELTGIYMPYFRAAFYPNRRFVGRPNKSKEIELGKYYIQLGKAITHDAHLKAFALWRGTAWGYNATYYRATKNNDDKEKDPMTIPSPPLAAIETFLSKYPEHGAMVCEDLFDMGRFGRDVDSVFNRKHSEKAAKIAVIKKYLDKMPPMVRYRAIRALSQHDKTVATAKEKAMLSPAHYWNMKKALDKAKIKVVTEKTPETEREKEFRKLIADFDRPEPKEKYVAERLVRLVAWHPSCWPEMMKTPERQWILYRAVTEHLRINANGYQPIASGWNHEPHWSEPHFRKLVTAEANAKKIEPWILMTWINAFRPPGFKNRKHSDLAGVPVMDKVKALPAYGKIPQHLRDHIHRGAPIAFKIPKDFVANDDNKKKKKKEAPKPVIPSGPFKEVLSLTKDSDTAAVTTAITTVLARLKTLPTRVSLQGESNIQALKPSVLGDPKVIQLVLDFVDNPHTYTTRGWGSDEPFCKTIHPAAFKSKDVNLIHRHAYILWRRALAPRGDWGYRNTVSSQEALLVLSPSAAATVARAGIHVYSTHKDKNRVSPMTALLSRANQAMKLTTIAVDESDPDFPVYKSQSEFVASNFESAWKLFEENSDKVVQIHRKLTPSYMLWVLERLIDQRDEAGQEKVVKLLQEWRKDAAMAFTKTQTIQLDILYGDIARQRGQLENAHKIYKAIHSNKNYADSVAANEAMLKQIEIERITKNFTAALATCEELIAKKVPEYWAEARYAKAEVFYDQEDYDGAKEIIEAVLKNQPGHKNATILDGKIKNKLKDLIGASEIEIGSATQQARIIPGEELKVTLNDPTLAVGSASVNIEVVVWSENADGTRSDEEFVLLRQFGDSKTKFRGTVPVRLGKPKRGDKVLQVIGDDKVYFSYSERFRKKVGDIEEWKGGPLSIVSDATLMSSARKLLSVEEQRAEDAAALARSLTRLDRRRLSAEEVKRRETNIARRALATADTERLKEIEEMLVKEAEKKRLQTRVKPGNMIYLRVVDEDRSRTSGIDEVVVSATSSSGDAVSQIVLKETDTHSGTFEGSLRTREAQAMAFATSTRSGLNPNMVISPKDHPAWVAAPSRARGKGKDVFTVDLNDNVPLETLTIHANEKGMALKKFRVLTGMNRKNLKVAATWPPTPMIENFLKPSVLIIKQGKSRTGYGNPAESRPFDLPLLRDYITKGYLTDDSPGSYAKAVSDATEAYSKQTFEDLPWVKKANHNSHVGHPLATRFRAYFYEKQDSKRQFRVVLGKSPKLVIEKKQGKHTRKYDASGKVLPCFVLINGKPLPNEGLVHEGTANLRAGLQRLEIIAQGRGGAIGFGRTCTVQMRLSPEEPWVDCPNTMFDPSTFPESIKRTIAPPPSIVGKPGGTEWTVTFPKGNRARVLKLELLEHGGPQASLSKLTLTGAGGKQILPVAADYAELGKNDTLEILTGDKIWLRYTDDRYVTKNKERQEKQLECSFSNGKAEFLDIEPRWNQGKNQMEEFRESILRFRMNEKLSIVVSDADMDVSDKPDTVEATLTTDDGKTLKITLTETDDSSGQFRTFITPVARTATGPNELQVQKGGFIELNYWDKENGDPGVPTARKSVIPHAAVSPPRMFMSDAKTEPGALTNEETGETTPVLMVTRPFVETTAPDSKTTSFIYGVQTFVDIVAPHLLLRPSSNLKLFLQTDTARKKAGVPLDSPTFDVTVEGTRLATARAVPLNPARGLNGFPALWLERLPAGYRRGENQFGGYRPTPGIFRISLTPIRESQPSKSEGVDIDSLLKYATAGTSSPLKGKPLEVFLEDLNYRERLRHRQSIESLGRELKRCKLQDELVIGHNDRIHVGLRYEDENGKIRWITATSKVVTHGNFRTGLADGRLANLKSAALGDRVRVVAEDVGYDKTDKEDTMTMTITSKSGKSYPLTLKETEYHSGVFETSFQLAIAKVKKSAPPRPPARPEPPANGPPDESSGGPPADSGDGLPAEEWAKPKEIPFDVSLMGFPAEYGDVLTITFKDSSGRELPPHTFSLGVGADGEVVAFTKQYTDAEMAVQTQFAMAEAFLEVAKRYRKLKNLKEAELAFQSAKRLLVSTIENFTDAETRAHAEYILGNLTFEEADGTKDKDVREERFQAALARYHKVTTKYPQTTFAAKSQFKKARVYEELNEPNVAAQEYVKLAYRYPDSENLAVALARLGVYFLKRGSALEKESKPLLAKIADKDAQFNGNNLRKESHENFATSGKIFERLRLRFPSHELAPKAGLLAGKSFLRINDQRRALEQFKAVKDEESYAGVARAEAMYWAGKCFLSLRENLAAYAVFKRCTFDFPETKWASFCQGEISQPALKSIEENYEQERVERGLIK